MRNLTRRAGLCASVALLATLLALPVAANQRVKTFDPNSLPTATTPGGNYLAAIVASSARDPAAAAVFLRHVLRADPRNADLLARSFEANLAAGLVAEAAAQAQTILRNDPRNGVARLLLGLRALKQGRFADARSRIVPSERRSGSDITGIILRAWAQIGAKDVEAAIKAVDAIGGDGGLGTFRDYHAALMADVAEKNEEALKRYRSAFGSGDRAPIRLVEAYASFLSRTGATDEARKILADFEKRVARHPQIARLSALLAEGRTLPRLVGSAQQGAAELLFGLGNEAARQPNEEMGALIYLRLARYLDEKHEYALVTIGEVYEKLRDYERAIDAYQEIPETSAIFPSARVQVALNLSALKRDDEAIAILKQIVAAKPGDVEAFTALGNILRIKKRYADAIDVYTRGLEAIGEPQPSLWSIYYFRGSAHERAKQWPKAEADFKKALELQPDNPQVLNYLGYSWVDQHMNIDEAFEMLKKAVALRPRDGYIVDSLGWAYYRLGKYDDAVRELERAVLLSPSDATINDHLGDAFWQVGRRLEAEFQWNHARDILQLKQKNEGLDDNETEELTKVLAKLRDGLKDAPKVEAAPGKTNGG